MPLNSTYTQSNNTHLKPENNDTLEKNSQTETPKKKYGKRILFVAVAATIFWFLEFTYQYFFLVPNHWESALIRSFALSGATLIGISLFSSAIFKWFPQTAKYWRYRRYFGVSGFVLISLHVQSVFYFLYQSDIKNVYFTFNPFRNPAIFGSISYFILSAMALTSSDWAVKKLTPKIWKFIHRFVYIAYPSSIFHFVLMNPKLLNNMAGYILLGVTTLALGGQLYWLFVISARKKFRNLGFYIGLVIIFTVLLVGYFAYKTKSVSL